jgi:hypothetical protein
VKTKQKNIPKGVISFTITNLLLRINGQRELSRRGEDGRWLRDEDFRW